MLNCFASGLKRAIKVLLLFNNLVSQGLILRLDAFDEDVREFIHVLQLAFHVLKFCSLLSI